MFVKKVSNSFFAPLLLPANMTRPVDWKGIWGNNHPLMVEIGSGLGEYLEQLVCQFPKNNIIGIEQDWIRVLKTLKRFDQSKYQNMRLLCADARLVFERLFFPQSISEIFVLFPCPWPKDRHEKHRLLTNHFFSLMNSRLVDGGQIKIVTDHQPYWEWVIGQIEESFFEMHRQIISPQFSTKFERKWLSEGKKEFYELKLIKKAHKPWLLKEDVSLQEMVLKDINFNSETFRSLLDVNHNTKQLPIIFKEYLYDPVILKGMLRTIVMEEGIKQELWIEIFKGRSNWLIRPSLTGGFIPTEGIRQALQLVYELTLKHA